MAEQKRDSYGRHEVKESALELFRGSLGIDTVSITIDGKRHFFCTEFNGSDSGIGGIQDLPKHTINATKRILAQIRNRASTVSVRPHAFENPPFIENIANDKSLQDPYLPEGHRLRSFAEGDSPVSQTGYWIIKPRRSAGGQGISIMSNEQFEGMVIEEPMLLKKYVAQEFILVEGASEAPSDQKTHPAAMRYLIDFVYRTDGTIEPVYEQAYQRVSPYPQEAGFAINLPPEGRVEDTFVVNRARGASSAPASREELEASRTIASAIIQNLAAGYKKHLGIK